MGKNHSLLSGDTGRSGHLVQEIVLPTYTLDSNLILLPGIIYNVTFSRYKAAALLYRYKNLVSQVSIINNLLHEYDFDENEKDLDSVHGNGDVNPSVISRDAVQGITQLFKYESRAKSSSSSSSNSGDSGEKSKQPTEFEWLALGIIPNQTKIGDVTESDSKVVTVSRIIGIADDTTNIKLTIQAITRGVLLDSNQSGELQLVLKMSENQVRIDWNHKVHDLGNKFKDLKVNYSQLHLSIERFLSDYRRALSVYSSQSNGKGNLSLVRKGSNTPNSGKTDSTNDKDSRQDLLTLNPLANSLYLQLVGSKDFNKAFTSLQSLFSQFSSDKYEIDGRTYLRLIDLTCGILPFPNQQKLALLKSHGIEERSTLMNEMIMQLNQIFESLHVNNTFVNNWFQNEATNIQKANVVANQLKSIRYLLEDMTKNRQQSNLRNAASSKNNNKPRNHGPQSYKRDDPHDEDDDDNDDDELRAIANFIKNKLPVISSLSLDSKRLITKDFKRIKASANSPGGGGNSDFHVLRNYLEIVMDIPWDVHVSKFKSNKEIDLKVAKKQLDDDHYGLEHVKRRLIQYLVVLKLLGINSENQQIEKSAKKLIQASNSKSGDLESGIVIANGDDTYAAKQQAKNKNKQSILEVKRDPINSSEALEISKQNRSPIIMLAGPPGTGKTSLAKSIATSLGRNFQRISLGGIKDESEIRGHRRTYVGAMPGIIIQALRKARCMNPVILLDEIDKVVGGNYGASRFNGDPSAALLEVLDPEQNNTFMDHYLGFPVDLSQVIFICTANDPWNMTRPLLDRLEMIEIGAYDYNEKLVIGKKYLLPRQIKRNGFPDVSDAYVKIGDEALKKIIVEYTRGEAGVRNFERKLGTLCRFKAVEYCEWLNKDRGSYNPIIEENDLPIYLGVPYSPGDVVSSDGTTIGNSRVGVVNGLSYNSEGSGSVLVFESIGFDRRNANDNDSSGSGPTLNMTGKLGDVLMESGKIGLIFIKLILYKKLLKTDDDVEAQRLLDRFNNLDIHMHVPMGSVSKDGPSAGITMALLFLSVLLDKPVPTDIAMTGEITLRGLVLPIGGVKEKLMGAHLSRKIRRMIVPRENRKDLIEEYTRSIEEAGEVLDHNLINELLKDNEEPSFKMHQVEEYYRNKYGISIYHAKEFYDVIRIVWNEDDMLIDDNNKSRLLEYNI